MMAVSFLYLISKVFGWIYFFCWSFSFYPQALLNFRRKSTSGSTIDFPAINLMGFIAYFTSNAAFLFSPQIRREYALRNDGLTPTVQINDLAFAGHAIVLTAITLSQYLFPAPWGIDKRRKGEHGARMSSWIKGIILGGLLGVCVTAFIVSVKDDEDAKTGWAWIDVVSQFQTLHLVYIVLMRTIQVYAISYVKVVITLVKYMPQVITNYRNKSTRGWSILQMLLDFVGGILSVSQLLIDSYLQGDWSGVTGNPVKLALGNFSMFFDIIFFIQHYCLYRGSPHKTLGDLEDDPLLDDSRDRERID
jgi:cystinosin